MASLTEFAPAKVNLHLHVVGRRDDGYHLLDSLVVFAAVGDRLSVLPASELSLSVTGPFAAGLEAETDNLVLRAARALASHTGTKATGSLILEKNLPIASGIGGGSADAAAALRLLSRYWRLEADVGTLRQIAGQLGADVPACLGSHPVWMSGVGEVLAPAPQLPEVGIMLVNPGVAVSTPSVFRARRAVFSREAAFSATVWRDAESFAASLLTTRNDLEPPARLLAPAIDTVLEVLSQTGGCLLWRMSGSGATCFGLFRTPTAAREAARSIARPGWWVWGGGLVAD